MSMTNERKEANDELRSAIEQRLAERGGTIRLTLPEPPPVNRLANRLLRAGFGCVDTDGENKGGTDDDQRQ